MSNELTPIEAFQDKVKAKLISDIGELMPDDVVKEMVDKAMHDAFFKPQTRTEGTGYHQKTVSSPSVFEETLKSLTEDCFKRCISQWIDDNQEVVEKTIQSFLKQRTEDAILSAIASAFGQHFETMKWNVSQDIINRLENQ